MANYKLITHTSQGQTSEIMFTAGGTNTVVSSITAKDGSGQTAEVLIQKSGGTIIEMAEVALTSNAAFQIIDVAFALEALDKVFIRASRGGMKFIMSYVEETAVPNDTALGGLVDVDTTGAADTNVLAYSSSAGVWQPVAAGTTGSGATSLNGLSDVTISNASTGKFLLHNGTAFVEQNFASQVSSNATVLGHTQKLANITVTQAVDLDAMESTLAAIPAAHYTSSQFATDFNTKTTADLTEASGSKYYTEARVSANTDVAANSAKVSYTGAAQLSTNTTKLAGIATGATANQTDAYLLNRVYHTGTQLAATVSDFSAAADTRIGAADIADLNNVSSTTPSNGQVLKWNGSAWAPAADNTASGSGGIVDSVNGISQSAVTLTTDNISEGSTNKYLTSAEKTKLAGIATAATANSTDAALKNRANHTGTQTAASISDFTAETESIIEDQLGNTGDLTEGTNLYYTNARVDARIALIDADDIDDAATAHKFVAAGDVTKLGHIAVTSAVNLNTMNTMATLALTTANSASNAVTTHANQLRNHGDVDYTEANPANIPVGSLFCWQGTEWKDKEVTLQDLSNVSTPTTGEFLKWDGTNWVTAAVTATAGATIQDADTALSAAGNYEAGSRLMKLVNTNTTLVSGKIFRLSGSGWDATTNATEAGSTGLMAMCSSDSTTGSAMITEGIARTRLSISGASIGDPVFLSTNNEVTLTAPTSAATVLQLGTVVDPTNNMIYFNPDKTTIRIQ